MTFSDIFRIFVKPEQVDARQLLGMDGLAQRNQERIEKIKAEMGATYILHPSHKKSKLDAPRPV